MSRAFEQRTFDFDDDGDDGVGTVRYDGRRGAGGVLAPGQRLVVPLRLMDGAPNSDLTRMQRLVAQDAAERQRARLHRPGFRLQPDAAARGEKLAAYDAYENSQREAWRSPPSGHGSRGLIDQREEGDACVIGGMTGTLVETGDGLVCIPNEWEAADAASLSDREVAHLQYIDRISNAWRNPDGDVVSDHRPAQRADAAPTRDAVEAAYAAYDAEIQERWRNPT